MSDDGITILNAFSWSGWAEGSSGGEGVFVGRDNGISVTDWTILSHAHTYCHCSCVAQRQDKKTHPGSSEDRWPLTRTSRLRSSPSGRLSSWRPACQ